MTTPSLLRSMLRMGQKSTAAVQASAPQINSTQKIATILDRCVNTLKNYAKKLALAGLASGTALLVNGCGGGGVGASTAPIVGGSIVVLPAVAELYEGQPVTFTISGGRPPYLVTSSNTALLPIPTGTSGSTFTLTSRFVGAETAVLLTVRDADNLTANTTANLRPFVLTNELELTPQLGSPGTDCGTAVCSGADATVRSRTSSPSAASSVRSVRFEVISGDFDFVTPGSNTLVQTYSTTSDSLGNAFARLKARVNAVNQSALMQVVDVTSGNTRKFVFSISQRTDGAGSIVVNPEKFAWTGFYKDQCVTGGVTNHYIYGGTPPYTVRSSTPDFATFAPSVVTTSGGAVSVATTGFICAKEPGASFIVTDAVGRTVTFSISNDLGAETRPLPPAAAGTPPNIVVTPASVGPLACGISAGAVVVQTTSSGISGSVVFTAASTEPSRVSAVMNGNAVTITHLAGSGGGSDTIAVLITNGSQVASIPVSLNPSNCSGSGSSSSNPIVLSTTNSLSVAVGASAAVAITGGRAPYGVFSASPNIAQVSVDGQNFATTTAQTLVSSQFVVRGVVPGVTFVTVVDSTNPQQSTVLAVTVTGTPALPGVTPLTANPTTISINGIATSPGSVSGGTPPYVVSAAGASIAQVSLDGVTFTTSSTGLVSQSGQFIVRSVANGTTFVNVADSSSPSRSVSIPVTVSGVGTVSNPINALPATLALTGTSSSPIQLTGGTAPFSVSSVGPSIAQVSIDGVNFQATSATVVSSGFVVVRGVSNGTTFVNVVDSSNPAKQTTIPVTVTGAGATGTPVVPLPASLTLTGASSSAVALSGGTAPYSVVSVGSTIAQVSGDGVTFASGTVPTIVNSLFVVRGVTNGTTFVTVTDSSIPPRSAAIPVAVTGAGSGSITPVSFTQGTSSAVTTVAVAGGSTIPVFISGGTGPNYTVSSFAPSIAQVSVDGNVFIPTSATTTAAGQFVIRGVSSGTTFITVSDSGSPVRSAVLAVNVTSTGAVITPITLSTSNTINIPVTTVQVSAVTITGGLAPFSVYSTAPGIALVSASGDVGTFVVGPITVGPAPPANQFTVRALAIGKAFVIVTDSSVPPVTTVLVVNGQPG